MTAAHWKSLERVLLKAEVDDTWQEAAISARKMHRIEHLDRHPDPLIQATLAEIDRRVTHYVANWTKVEHMISRRIPQKFKISAWAMISRGDGYNVPHIHKKGWITGVLYVAGPDRADAGDSSPGALRVGSPARRDRFCGLARHHCGASAGDTRPHAVLLHALDRTLGRPGLRIAIAFDVIDLCDDDLDQLEPVFGQLY